MSHSDNKTERLVNFTNAELNLAWWWRPLFHSKRDWKFKEKILLSRLANATWAKCIILQNPFLSTEAQVYSKVLDWDISQDKESFEPCLLLHALGTLAVLFLWLCPWPWPSHPTFPSTETGCWPGAHSLGTLCRGHCVLKNSWLSEKQPLMPFSEHWRSGNVRPESLSHEIVLLGQNPISGASFWHKLQAICSKTYVQNTETLLPQEVYRRCKECAEQVWGHSR